MNVEKIKKEAFKEAVTELIKENKDDKAMILNLKEYLKQNKKDKIKEYICKKCGTINNIES